MLLFPSSNYVWVRIVVYVELVFIFFFIILFFILLLLLFVFFDHPGPLFAFGLSFREGLLLFKGFVLGIVVGFISLVHYQSLAYIGWAPEQTYKLGGADRTGPTDFL